MERLAAFHRRLTADSPTGPAERMARYLLAPAGSVYGAVGRLRAALYHKGIFPSYRAQVPVVSVGNLAVGGTGKTPAVDHLVKLLLAEGKRVAVVSRGYGAPVEGVGIVSAGDGPLLSPAGCGDEPYLLSRRNPQAIVLVAPRRRDGVRDAQERFGAEVIVLDDGFQHLAVKRDLDIVLLDGRRPFGNGRVLPAGILRELPSALERGDLFLLTRCPDPLAAAPPGLPGPVLHSRHRLGVSALSLGGGEIPLAALKGKRGAAFAGIADPAGFFDDLAAAGLILTARIPFADHVGYGLQELERLARAAAGADYLVTTEKDGVKLRDCSFSVPCYQVPMTLQVLEDDELKRRLLAVFDRGKRS